jgi:archaellin
VFAFAALSTGLFSCDKAKEIHAAGLSETRGTLELKGSVAAKVSGTTGSSGVVTSVEFQLSNAAAGNAIDMIPGNTVIKYGGNNQTLTLNSSTEFSASNIASFGDSDYLLEVGEVFQVTLLNTDTQLTTDLGTNTAFTIEMVLA